MFRLTIASNFYCSAPQSKSYIYERGRLAERMGKKDLAQEDWKRAGVDELIEEITQQEKALLKGKKQEKV